MFCRKKFQKFFVETFLKNEGFGLLPVEFRTTKMSVGGCALENWRLQVQIPEKNKEKFIKNLILCINKVVKI